MEQTNTHPILHTLKNHCKTLNTLKQIHSQLITTGLVNHTYPISQILLKSSTLSTLNYTLTIFKKIPKPTIFLYNTLISALVKNNQTKHALSFYSQILYLKIKPNNYTFPSLFKLFGSVKYFRHGQMLHSHVIKFLIYPYDNYVQNSLLSFYSKCGHIVSARFIFNQINFPDLATWNSILSAYNNNNTKSSGGGFPTLFNNNNSNGKSNDLFEVLSLFSEMQMLKVKPNEVTFVALINACGELGAFSQGLWVHVSVIRKGLCLNRFLGSALVSFYANLGYVKFARKVFDEMPEKEKDTFCYNAMIRGFGIHGCGDEALSLFERMKREGFDLDEMTILSVMSACSHAGLVEEGRRVFESMRGEYGLEPNIEHYCCLVDILGRAGLVKEAAEKVYSMRMEPNAILWRSLLGAAKVHGNLEIGEIALNNLVKLEPETSGNYVLLSNMYACMNRWDDVKRLRKLMKDQAVDKMPGSSIVEVDGSMHEFLIGDKSHPRTQEIYLKLEEMNVKVQEYGYRPRTREVMFDIEEEDKGDALLYHSERLAIAFALITMEPGVPIRIIKNLRVCVDCHSSTKLYSLIYEREIVVRDRTRFHHFSNGTCSCSDYW